MALLGPSGGQGSIDTDPANRTTRCRLGADAAARVDGDLQTGK
ncbi:hypothetical protein ACWD4J_36065 [Streptomyces sp. NPDC002577]